jgi:BirA family biotin operon repressor/biotin-[acetyl-CoA-carboxylase] ligase
MPAMKPLTTTVDPEKISAHSPNLAQILSLEVVGETGSTNSDLLARCATLVKPIMLLAEVQTAGRGRAGRSWLSEPGSALTFSVAWPFTQTPQSLLGLPLAVGVALAEALISLDVAVQLKWPNDVLKNGKKLAGVLVETASHGNRTWAVIGIGLNLLMPTELEAQIGHAVADATWLAQMDRSQLLAVLLNHLVRCLQQFSASGLSTFVEPWNALHAYVGQRVNLIDQGKIARQGIALGINSQGCLMLQDESGVSYPVMVGDVSLRVE